MSKMSTTSMSTLNYTTIVNNINTKHLYSTSVFNIALIKVHIDINQRFLDFVLYL